LLPNPYVSLQPRTQNDDLRSVVVNAPLFEQFELFAEVHVYTIVTLSLYRINIQ